MKSPILSITLITVSTAALAQTTTSQHGALAIDRSNGFYYGWSYDYPTQVEAEQRALEECQRKGGECMVVLLYSGQGCAAYRTVNGDVGNAYGWGVAGTKEEADRIATEECLKRSGGKPASNFVWACNSKSSDRLEIHKNLTPPPNHFFGLKDTDGDLYDYEGILVDGRPQGIGVQTYLKSGSKYEGNFENGKKNGKGSFHFKSGTWYEGDFKDDRIAGRGIYYFRSGDRYEGEFKDDSMNGSGTYYFKSGKKYIGEVKNGQFNGYGKTYDSEGNLIHEGEYRNSEPVD